MHVVNFLRYYSLGSTVPTMPKNYAGSDGTFTQRHLQTTGLTPYHEACDVASPASLLCLSQPSLIRKASHNPNAHVAHSTELTAGHFLNVSI